MRKIILIGISVNLLLGMSSSFAVPLNPMVATAEPDTATLITELKACDMQRISLMRACNSCGLLEHINNSYKQLQATSRGVNLKNAPPDKLNEIATLNKRISSCCLRFINSLTPQEKQKLQGLCKKRAELLEKLYAKKEAIPPHLQEPDMYNSFFI